MASARTDLEGCMTVAEWMAIMYIVKEAQQVGKGVNLFFKRIETSI
jgi:hypothetical protein